MAASGLNVAHGRQTRRAGEHFTYDIDTLALVDFDPAYVQRHERLLGWPTALDEHGNAAAWVKRFGSGGAFVRYWGRMRRLSDPAERPAPGYAAAPLATFQVLGCRDGVGRLKQ